MQLLHPPQGPQMFWLSSTSEVLNWTFTIFSNGLKNRAYQTWSSVQFSKFLNSELDFGLVQVWTEVQNQATATLGVRNSPENADAGSPVNSTATELILPLLLSLMAWNIPANSLTWEDFPLHCIALCAVTVMLLKIWKTRHSIWSTYLCKKLLIALWRVYNCYVPAVSDWGDGTEGCTRLEAFPSTKGWRSLSHQGGW